MKNPRVLPAVIACVVFFGFTATVTAATFTVTNPAEFQTALTAAQNNGQSDTIFVAAGTYNITSTLTYVPVTAGEGNFSLTIPGIGTPVLDGGGSSRTMSDSTVFFPNDDSNAVITIEGIIFRNGHVDDDDGAGLEAETHNGTAALRNNIFQSNLIGDTGGQGGDAGVEAGFSSSPGSMNLVRRHLQQQVLEQQGGEPPFYSLAVTLSSWDSTS